MNNGFLSPASLRLLLILALIAAVLSTPGQSVSAQPLLEDTAFTTCDTVTGMTPAECKALVALYDSTDGANWTDNTGWLVTNTPCEWYGLNCWGRGYVTALYLNENGLKGTIPAELGNLTGIEHLNLNSNQLSGTIPPDLKDLTNLQNLFLHSNQLSGEIPPELGNMTNLQQMGLDHNQLSGDIPPELGNLANLKLLSLYSNQLTGTIPPELGDLTNLDRLHLHLNQLTGGIPSELGALPILEELFLNYNLLTGTIPVELGNLTNLRELHLDSNQLSGAIPTTITNLVNLTSVTFDTCAGLGSTDAAVVAFLNEKYPNWNDCLPIVISGNVEVGGASLKYTDGSLKTVAAEVNGDYSLEVSYFWSGTVTPSKAGFAFLPVNKSYTNVIADQTAQNFTASNSITVSSDAVQDGWVLESTEASKAGGSLNASDTTLRLGDDKLKKQYLGILSFATGVKLPDNAVITSVTLRVKKHSITGGGDPLTTLQGFMVDIKKGIFGTAALQTADFQTAATKSIGPVSPPIASGWYSINLTSGKASINKLAASSGLTQIRLRFNLDDNNNAIANYLSLYSGNAPAASRPQLVIQYTVP